MKIHAIALLAAALAVAGCTQQSERGGPGVKSNGKSTNGTTSSTTVTKDGATTTTKSKTVTDGPEVIDKSQTFAVNKPLTETNIKQGESDDVTLSIDRGSAFKQAVTLKFKPPQGVTVTPGDGVIKADGKDVKIIIKAAADAPVGKHSIEVTAMPESGKSVVTQLAIEVKKKD